MAEVTTMRLNKVLRELNISLDRAVEFLSSKGIEIEARPTTKITAEVYQVLSDEFETDASKKMASKEVSEARLKEKEALREELEKDIEPEIEKKTEEDKVVKARSALTGPKKVGKIELDKPKKAAAPKKVVEEKPKEEVKVEKKKVAKKEVESTETEAEAQEVKKEKVTTQYTKLSGPKKTGETIDLEKFKKPEKKKDEKKDTTAESKRKRRRISKTDPSKSGPGGGDRRKDSFKGRKGGGRRPQVVKEEPSEEEVQKQIRETLEKLQGKSSKGKGAKYRREKRDQHREQSEKDLEQAEAESKVLKVTEFVTANEVATMMDVTVTDIISACMSLGMMVTMNQRLDAETLTIVAEEFGYDVEFVTADIEESIEEVADKEEDLKPRAPIVTVMGHVDHGKTSLLDYIREENVIAGESGGITQHIGAYGVTLEDGQQIAFLDTPGHEAFTAMRARGAQVTDIAIIVIAADDDIMPQTKEAISHAQAAAVPIVFAINKIDRPEANPDKIKEGLANMNLLVEDWGGKIQSHDISAKTGDGVKELLEKVLLEAELLELKANPDKPAVGTVVEAYLDKGRGYVSTILVQAGTLRVGDYVLAGKNSGK
ncbi:MAG: GTP-binding protein, partial [Flavobacteriaceae bacterium]|nr:GTP-binding protein [Flavobacteriaceae bacterium]